MKAGYVAIVGKPNVGKSTLLNSIIGHKVAITSPKPQTTRFLLDAVHEDDRGQIIFVDTPGLLQKVEENVGKQVNARAQKVPNRHMDCVLYVIDHTKERGVEDNKALGLVRKFKCHKILVINKIDLKYPTHIIQYKFLEEEFDAVVEVSAIKRTNIKKLLEVLYTHLPEGEPLVNTADSAQPGLSIDSKTFIAEIIREKAFLFLRRELPYTLTTAVDEVAERETGNLYIKARIITNADRYKSMIIGKKGAMIKEISMAARKELEIASNKKVFLELLVVVDPHWTDAF